ncbi:conjugal transfer protein TraI [Salmonella enterica subsp. arizonae]|uniref:Conjugal transfer protein TraI n=1 Tax=Salmonella enterica subsp. arizonae TaxID=59203 RepID=A0A379T2J9_SALER|nr:conjugal transfer protein TraI [Salmonella enterica subsp. arizonae]
MKITTIASGSLESRWLGDGAEKLGLKGEVANADMDAIRQGKLPDGTDLSQNGQWRE